MTHRHRFWFIVDRIACACGLRLPACPVPSSLTGERCLLPDGHPADSHFRFHRYAERQGES